MSKVATSSPPVRLKPGEDGEHYTFCRICEALCGLTAHVEGGTIKKIGPDRDHPVSRGHLCVKGSGMIHVTYDPNRVLTPLRRTGAPGEFEPVSWNEALEDICSRLAHVIDKHGGESVGMYVGNPPAFGTQHMGYAFGFGKALGAHKFFTAVHADTAPKHVACEMIYGHPFHMPFPDLARCEFLLILGANPLVSHFSLVCEPRALDRLQTIAAKDGVVVVDPRLTETARRFEHQPILPDTDQWLLIGLLKTIFDEKLTAEEAALDQKVRGWRDLKAALRDFDFDHASAMCGIPADDIRTLARRFARSRAAACYGRIGTCRGRFTTLTNMLIEAVNLITGNFGAPGGMVIVRTPFEPDGDYGHPSPYGRSQSRIGGFPTLMGMTPGGTLWAEITTPGPGQIHALFIDGGNPVMSYPGGDLTVQALEQLDLLVAIDLFITESSRHAHYILPATTFLERADITEKWVTHSSAPWLQYTDAVIPPLGQARHEFSIYSEILERLQLPPIYTAYASPENRCPDHMDVADIQLRQGHIGDRFGARPEGYSLEKLKAFPHGVQYREFVDAAASWDIILFEDKMAHLWNDIFQSELDRLRHDRGLPDGMLRLVGRRYLRSINSWMHGRKELVKSDRPTLLMHPEDAAERGIADRAMVRLSSQTGSIEVEVELTPDIRRGVVSYPHGWGHNSGSPFANALPGGNVNLIASPHPEDWERASGAVHLDGIPVTVSKL